MDIEEGAQELTVQIHKAESLQIFKFTPYSISPLRFHNIAGLLFTVTYFFWKQIFTFDFKIEVKKSIYVRQ
jgi:hypothetical protein